MVKEFFSTFILASCCRGLKDEPSVCNAATVCKLHTGVALVLDVGEVPKPGISIGIAKKWDQ